MVQVPGRFFAVNLPLVRVLRVHVDEQAGSDFSRASILLQRHHCCIPTRADSVWAYQPYKVSEPRFILRVSPLQQPEGLSLLANNLG